MTSLQNSLTQKLGSAGWAVRSDGSNLTAEREDIISKWLLGKRSVKLKLNLKFDEPNKMLDFQEIAMEKSSGLPPPTLSVTISSQSGMKVNEHRIDVGIGAGGVMNYGNARQWMEQQCQNEGWGFRLKI